jgi:hypothetical protein
MKITSSSGLNVEVKFGIKSSKNVPPFLHGTTAEKALLAMVALSVVQR